eukprot:TRINITY_DN3594_c0_g1_i1.p1 TRINITY_DN3594_c0_g1~~TRINITY_DN3594_c0_g1_i1.p1  ORF type:complete len:115 (-),score=18.76 TRINITY_DN3594_c0_g1_i1:323-667(-)
MGDADIATLIPRFGYCDRPGTTLEKKESLVDNCTGLVDGICVGIKLILKMSFTAYKKVPKKYDVIKTDKSLEGFSRISTGGTYVGVNVGSTPPFGQNAPVEANKKPGCGNCSLG